MTTARGRRVVSSLNLLDLMKKNPCPGGLQNAITALRRQRCLSAPRGFLTRARRNYYNLRMDGDLRDLAEEVEIRLHPDILQGMLMRSRDFQEYIWKVLFPSNRKLVYERLPADLVASILGDRELDTVTFRSGFNFNPGYFASGVLRPGRRNGNYGEVAATMMAYTLAEQERLDDDRFYETYPQP